MWSEQNEQETVRITTPGVSKQLLLLPVTWLCCLWPLLYNPISDLIRATQANLGWVCSEENVSVPWAMWVRPLSRKKPESWERSRQWWSGLIWLQKDQLAPKDHLDILQSSLSVGLQLGAFHVGTLNNHRKPPEGNELVQMWQLCSSGSWAGNWAQSDTHWAPKGQSLLCGFQEQFKVLILTYKTICVLDSSYLRNQLWGYG